VVDDDEPVARLICDALSAEGHAATRAAGAEQALERLLRQDVDLVICDMRMPGMSGGEVHATLCRERPDLVQRLLLTTGDTLGNAVDALGPGHAVEVLCKPFDLDDLRARVRGRLDGHE
jgi:DNA-binding response OmpR family regulator